MKQVALLWQAQSDWKFITSREEDNSEVQVVHPPFSEQGYPVPPVMAQT